jgi:uncharacterized membrane protein (Fun14 family)
MKWRERLFYLAVGIAIGFFFPHLIQLKFNYEYDVSKVATVVGTVLTVYFIQAILLQKYSNIRVEKDILIERANEVLKIVKEGRKIFLESFESGTVSPENERTLKTLLRDFANELAFLQECADHCKLKVARAELLNAREGLSEYRLRLSGGAFPGTPYSQATLVAVERVYKDLRKNLQRFVLAVNRM